MFNRRKRFNVRNGNFEVRAEFVAKDTEAVSGTYRIIFDDFAVFANQSKKGLNVTWIDLDAPEPEFKSGTLIKQVMYFTSMHAANKNLLIFLVLTTFVTITHCGPATRTVLKTRPLCIRRAIVEILS